MVPDSASASWRQAIIALIVCVPLVGYPVWALLDREPPYIRQSGVIVPVAPQLCGLPAGEPEHAVLPGSCVAVQWQIRELRRCPPNVPNNITRVIQDSEKVPWMVGPIPGYYGTINTPKPGSELTRFFIVPSGAKPGPALYKSSATFACNLLQTIFWPINVNTPDIAFEIKPR